MVKELLNFKVGDRRVFYKEKRVSHRFLFVWSKEPVKKGNVLSWFDKDLYMVELAGDDICGVASYDFEGLGWMQTFGPCDVFVIDWEKELMQNVKELIK